MQLFCYNYLLSWHFIMKDQRGYLLPYMVVMPMLILLQVAEIILVIVALATVSPFHEGQPDRAHIRSQMSKSGWAQFIEEIVAFNTIPGL